MPPATVVDASPATAGLTRRWRGRVPRPTFLLWLVAVELFTAGVGYAVAVAADRVAADRGAARPTTVDSRVPAAAHSDGLSDRHDGYQLVPVSLPTGRGRAVPVVLRILGPDGTPAVRYETVHTRPLHLYLVREDLSVYQHLHPQYSGDTWTAAVDVPDGGVYRIYTEFTPVGAPAGHATVLGLPFVITGDTSYVRLPAAADSVGAGGFTVVRLDGGAPLTAGVPVLLRFQVRDTAGVPVRTLEPYLGVYAHVSAFDALTQAMTHLHPAVPSGGGPPPDGGLTFHAQFPGRGEHRLFLQFQVAGVVQQAAITVVVG